MTFTDQIFAALKKHPGSTVREINTLIGRENTKSILASTNCILRRMEKQGETRSEKKRWAHGYICRWWAAADHHDPFIPQSPKKATAPEIPGRTVYRMDDPENWYKHSHGGQGAVSRGVWRNVAEMV